MRSIPLPAVGYLPPFTHECCTYYLNSRSNQERLLLLAWITYTIATPKSSGRPRPLLVVTGNAGSGKSFLCSKILRAITDPSLNSSQSLPRSDKDIAISAQNNHVLIYDNLRKLSHSQSDFFCQVVTGGTLSSRKLYSDAEESVLNIQCSLILNGIHSFVTESDLASRCINIHLKKIGEDKRETEDTLLNRFRADLPGIIYSLHHICHQVLKVIEDTQPIFKGRLADFSLWLAAMENVLKIPAGKLQVAYKKNIEEEKVRAVQDDSLFSSLLEFSKNHTEHKPWTGAPHQLYDELVKMQNGYRSDMPRDPSAMSRKLKMLKDALYHQGVEVINGRHGAGDRFISVWYMAPHKLTTLDPQVEPPANEA